MLPLKPHTVSIQAVEQGKDDTGTRQNLAPTGEPVSDRVYIEQMTPGDAFQATGIELKFPALLMCDPGSVSKYAPGYEVTHGTTVYRVVGLPLNADAGNPADHGEIWLEFKQFGSLPS